jgi:hypothetical protein
MAGTLTISTLKDSSGVLATQNGMTGICKAWCAYNGDTSTIRGSFNVSSVTQNATANYTFNFTTVMANANYSVVVTGQEISGVGFSLPSISATTAPSTSGVRIAYYQQNSGTTNTSTQNPYACMAILGN